jgi:hypothetical protein
MAALFRKSGGVDREPVPFIVGVGRSGTTMLRLMLDSHPELAIPPETHFVPELIDEIDAGASPAAAVAVMTAVRQWGDLQIDEADVLAAFEALDDFSPGAALRAFYALYLERQGKPRWGEKTPAYVRNMRKIEAALPEARFIHVIRDGRIRRAQKQGRRLDHYIEVRYEDLVTDTEAELRRIAEFIRLDWDPVMLRYYERAADRMAEMARDLPSADGKPVRPGEERMQAHAMTQRPPDPSAMYRWKERMSAEDVAAFEAAAGGLLAELGYEVGAAAE